MSKPLTIPAVVAAVLLVTGVAAQAAAKGPTPAQQKTLATCLACHDASPAKAQRVGPGLFGLAGAKPRSPGMPNKAWDKKSLDAFLKDPQAFKPGSTMPLKVENAAERAAIVKALLELK